MIFFFSRKPNGYLQVHLKEIEVKKTEELITSLTLVGK